MISSMPSCSLHFFATTWENGGKRSRAFVFFAVVALRISKVGRSSVASSGRAEVSLQADRLFNEVLIRNDK